MVIRLSQNRQYSVIDSQSFTQDNIYYAVYVDGTPTNEIPAKGSNYALDLSQSTCTNGVSLLWDSQNWTISVDLLNYSTDNTIRTRCDLYFKTYTFADILAECDGTAAQCIIENANLNRAELANFSELAPDGSGLIQEIRYIGADPNNYVDIGDRYGSDIYYGFSSSTSSSYHIYNSEEDCTNASSYNVNCTKMHSAGDVILWRIIGAFNNVDDGTGNIETRLKIIRDETIGNFSWDYEYNGTSTSYRNDWSTSTLMNLLNNGAYYNRTTGSYYNGSRIATTVDFTAIGLTEEAKSFISDAKWYLGGSTGGNLTSDFYNAERGTDVYTGNATEWTGKIGLIYPSDFGYATSGGTTTDRNSCLNISLYLWNESLANSVYPDCYENDWLLDTSNDQWTLTLNPNNYNRAVMIYNLGRIASDTVDTNSMHVYPSAYLYPSVKITGGTGSSSDPFILSF